MANTITSPNMNLSIPVQGIDAGPDYALNINACLLAIDGHDHSSGSGVPVTPAGLNITSDLSIGSNNLTNIRSSRMTSQSAVLALGSDLDCLYVVGVDLYYNDGNGANIRITQSGGVAGSPGSISNLTSPASAAYVAANQTFVWQSAANTPANMDNASVILRNLSANSKGLTLGPPLAMAANYSLTLPSLPGATSFMTLDATGTMGSGPAISGGITGSNIASATIAGSNMIAGTVGPTQLANTGVSAGSYLNASIIVDAQGRITSAAAGNSTVANTYTPTAVAGTRVSSVTPTLFQYLGIAGSETVYTVSGRVDIVLSSTGAFAATLTLPTLSNTFAHDYEACGTAVGGLRNTAASISANVGTKTVTIAGIDLGGTSAQSYFVNFTYRNV